MLMLDVDHFKMVNDRHGHAGGDGALRHLVATLRAGIRQADLLGRLGGEEFGIVLQGVTPELAEQIAERLRLMVAESPHRHADRLITMTVSVGMALAHESDVSVEQIMARADRALYHAKDTGRNRVVKHHAAIAA
jgi:diguanylate cyclase (GGDEF)-like protein